MKKMLLALLLGMSVTLFLGWGITRGVKSVLFDRACGYYLQRAAYANTVELAVPALETALNYMEKKQLTNGYTSVLYTTPDEDIGFWYHNIKDSLAELKSINNQSTALERSNVLIKLRESLTRHSGEGGEKIIVPDGISIFPYNALFFWIGWISFIGAVILLIIVMDFFD